MKLLESTRFEALNNALSINTGGSKIIARIESYSCKMTASDKQFYKRFNAEEGVTPHDLQALSPPQTFLETFSTLGGSSRSISGDEDGLLCDTISRKTLFYLIATLNSVFADYDFSDSKSDEFTKHPSLQWVKNSVDSNLNTIAGDHYHTLRSGLWEAINDEIALHECDIYSYKSDLVSDPYGDNGCMWSFNYFFYNKKLKRIVFFTCRAIKYTRISLSECQLQLVNVNERTSQINETCLGDYDMLRFLVTLGIGVYAGIYIAQNYEIPRVDEPAKIYERVTQFLEENKKKP